MPFSWDEVYTFAPYTPVEEIQQVIGARATTCGRHRARGMLQLVFLDEGAVTAAICGFPAELGYEIVFPDAAGTDPGPITHGEDISSRWNAQKAWCG